MQQMSLDDTLAVATATPSTGRIDDAGLLSRIEAATYGDEAPVQEAEVETEEEVSEAPPAEEVEEPTDEGQEEEETETEDDEAETDEEEESDDAENESDDTIEMSEEQLAAVLELGDDGVKVDEEGNLTIRTKIDGEVGYVPMKDLVTSYQLEKHLRNKSQVDAEARREFEAFKAEETTKLQTTVTDATALVVEMENQLTASVKGVDMEALRQSNPGEYAALQQDIAARQNYIAQAKGKLGEVIQAQQAEQAQKAEEARQAYVLEQTEQLITKIPRWSDSEVAKTEIGQLQKSAIEAYGFTEEEISSIGDHRIVLALMDAIKGRSMSDPEPVKKRLKAVPKITKPGSRKVNTSTAKQRALQAKVKNLKQSGKTQDAAALLMDMI